jgi:hypothetical protein
MLERLGDIIVSPRFHGFDRVDNSSKCGDDNDDHIGMFQPYPLQQLHCRTSRQVKVSQENIVGEAPSICKASSAVAVAEAVKPSFWSEAG